MKRRIKRILRKLNTKFEIYTKIAHDSIKIMLKYFWYKFYLIY